MSRAEDHACAEKQLLPEESSLSENQPQQTDETEQIQIVDARPITFTVDLSDVCCDLSGDESDNPQTLYVTKNPYTQDSPRRVLSLPGSRSYPSYSRLHNVIPSTSQTSNKLGDDSSGVDPEVYFIKNIHCEEVDPQTECSKPVCNRNTHLSQTSKKIKSSKTRQNNDSVT